MQTSNNILVKTLARLRDLYISEGLEAGMFSQAVMKPGWNVVVGTNNQCGTSMNFTGFQECFGEPSIDIARVQSYIGKSLFEIAGGYLESASWQERSIGVAAISALSQPLMTPSMLQKRGFAVSEAGDFSNMVQKDDIIAVIGYGGGVRRLIGRGRELHVTDIRPREAFQNVLIGRNIEYTPGGVAVHPEPENREVISRATAVYITGSSLVNGSFEELAGYARKARIIDLYGASACIIPDALFERGVSFVHTYRLCDAAKFIDGAMNDMNMEAVIHNSQKYMTVLKGQPVTS